jgi:NDP-sugar pyrophosphorylase family protein
MMQDELRALGAALCEPGSIPRSFAPDLAATAAGAVVVLPAGGFGYRLRGAGPEGVTQKALMPLPNGETLLGRVIRQYAGAGFREFVALVNHQGREVEEHLAGGAPWGVTARCSYDPQETGSGRTGAMLNAAELGILPTGRLLMVHNADCQVFGYEGSFPLDFLRAHLWAEEAGNALAPVAAVDGSPYAYTGMGIRDGMVSGIEMYPFVPIPAHAGITAVVAAALADIQANARESKKNFEQDMFPRWAAAARLGAMVISHTQWAAVDDRKAYRNFCAAVEGE